MVADVHDFGPRPVDALRHLGDPIADDEYVCLDWRRSRAIVDKGATKEVLAGLAGRSPERSIEAGNAGNAGCGGLYEFSTIHREWGVRRTLPMF